MTPTSHPITTQESAQRYRQLARAWQTNAALLLIGIGLIRLSRQLVLEHYHFAIGFSGVAGWSAILYILAVFLILTQPVDRATLPIIFIVAIACRIPPLLGPPFLSTDIYRYVWDGVVQHAHISPYRYAPGDPALAFLRAPCQDLFDHINRRDYAHTIYPPVAQVLFYCITAISPTVAFMKTVMVAFEGVTLFALIKILLQVGLRPEQSLLYAWCPLLFWEIAGAGHLDSAAMAFIALALLFRLQRRAIPAGLFLGLAVMIKFYPVVLLPALVIPCEPPHTTGRWALFDPRNWDWKLPSTVFAVIAISYVAYSSVGLLVFGFLGGYVHEEGIVTGTRYFLLELVQHLPGLRNLPMAAFYLFCAFVFIAIKIWSLRRNFDSQNSIDFATPAPNHSFLVPAYAFAVALMLLFSPHYPWYILWLVPFFTLQPNLPILTYLMGVFYLLTTPLADGAHSKMYILNQILYGAVAFAALIHLAFRKRTLSGLNFHQTYKSL